MTDAGTEFTIRLDGVDYHVAAEGKKITVNGRAFVVEKQQDGSVLIDGIAYDVSVLGDTVHVNDSNHTLAVSGLSVRPTGSSAPTDPARTTQTDSANGAIVAMMPGKVTRILVEEGQEVQEGQPVCVLEAMKMENELRAERSGVVQAVHVRAGEDVEKDQVLATIA